MINYGECVGKNYHWGSRFLQFSQRISGLGLSVLIWKETPKGEQEKCDGIRRRSQSASLTFLPNPLLFRFFSTSPSI